MEPVTYRYQIKSTGGSTQKYGLCEVCGQPVSEVFHQVEEYEYKTGHWTRYNCTDLFGHKKCLKRRQRQN